MKTSTRIRSVVAIIGIVMLSMATKADAATNFLRRPFNTVLSPMVTAYYDDNRSPTGIRDYMCGTNTYEDALYGGHTGVDFNLTVGTPVYAGAAGGMYQRYDGCSTYGFIGSTCGNGYGNHVRLDHTGNFYDGVGLSTIYGHLQLGSVAPGPFFYGCGSQIGLSGSSGYSSGPHLHFELRANGTDPYSSIDPFSGSCSHAGSYWVNQNGGTPTTQCL